jgi:hypothetical protein
VDDHVTPLSLAAMLCNGDAIPDFVSYRVAGKAWRTIAGNLHVKRTPAGEALAIQRIWAFYELPEAQIVARELADRRAAHEFHIALDLRA